MILVRVRDNDPRVRLLQKRQVPFVVFGRDGANTNYTHIDVDGEMAQYTLTRHLIERGHRDIAYIVPPRHLSFTQYRLRGFRRAMAEAGLPVREPWLLTAEHMTENGGRTAATALLDDASLPTAIMAGNDRMALGVMASVQERGLQVGTDVAVTGFDNIPAAEHVYPGLTTMYQPIYTIGEQLTDYLLGTIVGTPPANPTKILNATLIVRGSTVST